MFYHKDLNYPHNLDKNNRNNTCESDLLTLSHTVSYLNTANAQLRDDKTVLYGYHNFYYKNNEIVFSLGDTNNATIGTNGAETKVFSCRDGKEYYIDVADPIHSSRFCIRSATEHNLLACVFFDNNPNNVTFDFSEQSNTLSIKNIYSLEDLFSIKIVVYNKSQAYNELVRFFSGLPQTMYRVS